MMSMQAEMMSLARFQGLEKETAPKMRRVAAPRMEQQQQQQPIFGSGVEKVQNAGVLQKWIWDNNLFLDRVIKNTEEEGNQ
jgi:hypothetical protein